MSVAGWLNAAWMVKCLPEARAFRRATRQVATAQAAVLMGIVRANQDTDFGRRHGFAGIDSPRAYLACVPLSRYEDCAAAIGRIAAGDVNVLTREPVVLLEPTSGTVAGEKLIPYTASLRREFQRAVATWIADLFWQRPAVRGGRAYWSISPALGPPRRTAGGIPIGFDDDAAYLGAMERLALARLLVVPPSVARLADMDAFRYATLRCLLRAADLTLLSVWSPSFLTALLAPLADWRGRLAADIEPRRAEVLRSNAPLPELLRQLWPRLALISCWADGAAAGGIAAVRQLFPGVEIQAKGLIATEGFVSLPLVGRPAPALALRSHFFEFHSADGACRLAHELELGGRYCVVLTTGGGLYRYQLRDEVEIVGFENDCPLLRFLGKADRVSDLVGEKLAEPHVRGVLDRVFAANGMTPSFALLVPVHGTPSRYRLYLQGPAPRRLAEALESGLRDNPYYRHAVAIGQLAAAEIETFHDGGADAAYSVYERHCLARGQKAGNIKPAALDAWTGWPAEFAPLVGVYV